MHRSHVSNGSTVDLSIDNVLALLARSASSDTEVRKCVLPFQLENAGCTGGTRHVWTRNTHRYVVTFGITRMSVEMTERARENERINFKAFVEVKHVSGHRRSSTSTMDSPLYTRISDSLHLIARRSGPLPKRSALHVVAFTRAHCYQICLDHIWRSAYVEH